MSDLEIRLEFGFRPWVRSTCRKAMIWGVGLVVLLAGVTWWLKAPGPAPEGRAFGVLAFYAALFWLTLLKVWWTAGKAAVVLDSEQLGYQPLHTFRLKGIPFEKIQFCAPREGTQSLRLIHEHRPGKAREFYLNLAVIDGRNEFLDALEQRLAAAGLVAFPGKIHTWTRPGWALEEASEE